MIRYLAEDEKTKSRALWREAFPEDSESFDDYYYTEKIRDNQILVMEEDGKIISMLHLNPYQIAIQKQIRKSVYIVGVATTKEKRHEGHMRAILTQAMEDLYQQGMGFAFLMPADAKIYQPFDFTYIFDQPHWKLKDRMPIRKHRYHAADETEQYLLQELSDWTNVWLQRRYEVYAFRSRIYYQRLMKELASEQGETSLLYNDERLVGVESIWGLDKREQRMLLCDDLYCEEAEEATPAIMARILHLENFIKMIGLKDSCKEESLTVSLSVEDQFCKENRGTYQWCLRRDGSSLKKLTDSPASLEKEGGLSVTISQLTSWLFGYSVPDREDWTAKVHTLRGVFLDEVV